MDGEAGGRIEEIISGIIVRAPFGYGLKPALRTPGAGKPIRLSCAAGL